MAALSCEGQQIRPISLTLHRTSVRLTEDRSRAEAQEVCLEAFLSV